jgi:DNA-binding HxlR family transcriptional regulator
MPATPPRKRHPYDQWSPDARALDLVGDKWTLLIIRDLAAGARRFVELQRGLPGISTEQLRSRLNRMVADGLLTRQRFREVPPRVDYGLTDRARDLMPVLGALARWGIEWSWSPPRRGEAVDVTAIFRLAAGLVQPREGIAGTVELELSGGAVYTVALSADRVEVLERPDQTAEARVEGPEAAWVAALQPNGSRDGLTITGDLALGSAVLDDLAQSGPAVAAGATVAA